MVANTKIQKTKKIITKNSEESEEEEKEEEQQQQASKKPDEIEPPKRTNMIWENLMTGLIEKKQA